MTNAFSWFSENTLFSLLIAAFIGWIAVSAASGPITLSPVAGNAVAQAATAGGNS
ncbi:MAG TPA: hypothetical protein VH278_10915 [Burkholderiaceae bacterium]|jgi:hypothetical protein|nr:hypothetical protein [Burkholderiaceae bacterium]